MTGGNPRVSRFRQALGKVTHGKIQADKRIDQTRASPERELPEGAAPRFVTGYPALAGVAPSPYGRSRDVTGTSPAPTHTRSHRVRCRGAPCSRCMFVGAPR